MKNFKVDNWTKAAIDVLENSQKYQKYIEKSESKLLSKYSLEAMVDQYINIYRHNE